MSDPRPGWVCEAGVWRRETILSMLRRLPGWDYRKPWIYQITLVCAERRAGLLGSILVRRAGEEKGDWVALEAARGLALEPEAIEAKVEPTALGAAIRALFWRFGDHTPEIRPLACEVMPDHLHLIVQVTREMARPLGNAIGGFKTGCEKLYRKLSLSEPNGGAASGGAVGGASGAGGAGASGGAVGGASGASRLFAEGFQDSILFREGQLQAMFAYLADNARRRAIKALYPDLFRVVGRLGVDLWLSPQEPNASGAGAGGAGASEAGGGAGRLVPRARARGWFMALGNRFLLGRPLAQVQVSRRDFAYRREPKAGDRGLKIARDTRGEPLVDYASPAYAAKRDSLLLAAKHGAVLLSPCVSDGERQIAREALAAGLGLVVLRNKGFSPLQKPSGRAFDACSDGRLLMLAPAAWPYVPGEKPMTRFDATAMNRLCQWIAGEDAAEINYHGMRPANIDALARAAAQVGEEEGLKLAQSHWDFLSLKE